MFIPSSLIAAVLSGLLATNDLPAEWQYTIVTSPLSLDGTVKHEEVGSEGLARLLLDGVLRAVSFRRVLAVEGSTGDCLHKLAKAAFATYKRPE
jgi:hypothetical protein